MAYIPSIIPWVFIAVCYAGLFAASIVVPVALWRGMKAQEESARRLAIIQKVLAGLEGVGELRSFSTQAPVHSD